MRFLSLFLQRLSSSLTASFLFTFPVAAINRLGQCVEFRKCGRFSYVGHFILYARRKYVIELVSECAAIPTCNGDLLIELDEVFCNVLSGFHRQILEFAFGFCNYVWRCKIGFQLGDKFIIIVIPGQWIKQVQLKETILEVSKGNVFEIQDCEFDFFYCHQRKCRVDCSS